MDTYTLICYSVLYNLSWFFCILVFLFQLVLIAIILFDQFFDTNFSNLRNGEVTLDLPDSVPTPVYIGELLVVLDMILCQMSAFETLKTIMVLLHLKKYEWLEVICVDS